jgi:hypothetical protein
MSKLDSQQHGRVDTTNYVTRHLERISQDTSLSSALCDHYWKCRSDGQKALLSALDNTPKPHRILEPLMQDFCWNTRAKQSLLPNTQEFCETVYSHINKNPTLKFKDNRLIADMLQVIKKEISHELVTKLAARCNILLQDIKFSQNDAVRMEPIYKAEQKLHAEATALEVTQNIQTLPSLSAGVSSAARSHVVNHGHL